MTIALIHDGDHGGDGFITTMLFCAYPSLFDLQGVTTVLGNTNAAQAARNARKALALCHRQDIAVRSGAEAPLAIPYRLGDDAFGSDGLGQKNGLRQLAARFANYLATEPQPVLGDVAHTANVGRARLRHRLALTAADVPAAQMALAAFAQGETVKHAHYQTVKSGKRPSIVFLFTGQGAQYVAMGRQLYETAPVFRQALDRCDGLLPPYRQPLPAVAPLSACRCAGPHAD